MFTSPGEGLHCNTSKLLGGRSFRSHPSPRGKHPRKLADALPQLTPAFERPVDGCLFLFDVREACTLHLFGSIVEAFGAYGIHRKKAECLREWYTISSRMQKFNVRIHFPENCTQAISPSVPSGIGPLTSRADPPVNERR